LNLEFWICLEFRISCLEFYRILMIAQYIYAGRGSKLSVGIALSSFMALQKGEFLVLFFLKEKYNTF